MSEPFNQAFIDSVVDDLDLEVEQVSVKLALDAHRGFVIKTPVDTGRAKLSWNISKVKPDKSVPKTGGKEFFNVTLVDNPNHESIFITSSIPYMARLEEGHSKQGHHMVKRTINEITQQLR